MREAFGQSEPELIDNTSDIPEGREGEAERNQLQRKSKQSHPDYEKYLELIGKKMNSMDPDEIKKLGEQIHIIESKIGISRDPRLKVQEGGEEMREQMLEAREEMKQASEVARQQMLEAEKRMRKMTENTGENISEMMGNLLNIVSNTLFPGGLETIGELEEKVDILNDKISKIEEYAPGFTQNLKDINTELEKVLSRQEPSPELDSLNESLKDDFYRFVDKIDSLSNETIARKAVSDYLTDINSRLSDPLNTNALD